LNRFRWATVAVLSTVLFGGVAAPAAQAAGNREAKLLMMALSPTTKNMCGRAALRPSDCTGYNNVGSLGLYPNLHFVYALVVQGSQVEGIAGVEFGIDYDGAPQSGVDIYSWHPCADAETPDAGWPAPGTGNVLTFNSATNCQTAGNTIIDAVAVLGYFYTGAYTADLFRMTPHPGSGVGTVLNCADVADTVKASTDPSCTRFGALGFGSGMWGINPCRYEEPFGCDPSPPAACVEGPSTVTVGTTATFSIIGGDPPFFGPWNWTVTGPAQIVAHDEYWREIEVLAAAPGTYTVRPYLCPNVPHVPCSNCQTHSVLVEEAVPTVNTTWGRIKVLVR
jgi:hypothetical protein